MSAIDEMFSVTLKPLNISTRFPENPTIQHYIAELNNEFTKVEEARKRNFFLYFQAFSSCSSFVSFSTHLYPPAVFWAPVIAQEILLRLIFKARLA